MNNDSPPSIRLHANSAISEQQLAEVLLGIEEEGIPVEIERFDELNPLVLAHQAAISSRLGIGIGMALDYAVITTEKLPEARPYLTTWLNTDADIDRAIGANAARMVKRTPLRPMSGERNP
ncbi:MAG: glycerol dehydratase reactivase beta/small subunit family protein [Acidobacteriota bacterium]|nr:glycerol dehydratase reactivase beta/small subunit family protein [Acidobacteriota bacterium]NLH69294.1 glycerol dehydratase reactivation factor [Brooklawnia sp.]